MSVTDEAKRAAEAAYSETLSALRLAEGGGLRVASQGKRALHAALEAVAPHIVSGFMRDNMIPAEAVEAAAKAIYHPQPLYDEDKGEFTGNRPWEWLTPQSQEALRQDARAALEAAASHILAQDL